MSGSYSSAKVHISGTLRDALEAIEVSGLEIALAVDDGDRLVGILTDGDIRGKLLSGVSLDRLMEPHVQRRFTQVGPGVDRCGVLDLMQALSISQIPVTDVDGKLVGLHTLRGIIGTAPRPNWAVVMAGGRGERLRPLTDSIPKPMIKVAGRPILERIVLHLVGCGIRKIFISVNYKADVIEAHFLDGSAFGCAIEYLRERKPLGTGGSLSLLPQGPSHPTLVLNGDLMTQVDVTTMLAFHEAGGYRATVGIHEYAHTVPLGVVEVDGERVVKMREKPTQIWRVNAGIYVLDPEILRRVPVDTYFGLPALLEECLEASEAVGAFHVREDWADIGHHRELTRARGED